MTIRELCEKNLISKLRQGYCKDLDVEYTYTPPSSIHHFQWLWDSCFHTIILSKNYPEIAMKEIKTLLKSQDFQQDKGFVPHVIVWEKIPKRSFLDIESGNNPRFSAYIQPPVIPISVKTIFDRTQNYTFLEDVFERLVNYMEYLSTKRDPDKDGLISIIMSRESGLDCSPIYDIVHAKDNYPEFNYPDSQITHFEILRKYRELGFDLEKIFEIDIFNVEDLLVNSIYYLALKSMADLSIVVGDRKLCEKYNELAFKIVNTVMKKCWDEEDKIFYSLSGKNEKKLRIKTIHSLMPIVMDELDEYMVKALVDHILNKNEFFSPYPIPTVAMDEDSFQSGDVEWYRNLEKRGLLWIFEVVSKPFFTEIFEKFFKIFKRFNSVKDKKIEYGLRDLWRGQTWINTNWFIYLGLKRHGYNDIAKYIAKKSIELVSKYGLREFYDSISGEGGGARKFGWSGLVSEMTS